MKTIFKICLIAILLVAGAADAEAGKARTTQQILRDFFPRSERVSFVKLDVTAERRATIEKRLGQRLQRASYYFYVATTAGRIDGYAFIDDELGQHEPITFAVRLRTDGVVDRQEVLAYREAWGEEIRDPRFRRQFVGKRASDPCQLDVDIDAVSGATISSGAMARGVKRALVLFDVGVRPPTRAAGLH